MFPHLSLLLHTIQVGLLMSLFRIYRVWPTYHPCAMLCRWSKHEKKEHDLEVCSAKKRILLKMWWFWCETSAIQSHFATCTIHNSLVVVRRISIPVSIVSNTRAIFSVTVACTWNIAKCVLSSYFFVRVIRMVRQRFEFDWIGLNWIENWLNIKGYHHSLCNGSTKEKKISSETFMGNDRWTVRCEMKLAKLYYYLLLSEKQKKDLPSIAYWE